MPKGAPAERLDRMRRRSAEVRTGRVAARQAKRCPRCGETLPLQAYGVDRSRRGGGRDGWCKSCRRQAANARYRAAAERRWQLMGEAERIRPGDPRFAEALQRHEAAMAAIRRAAQRGSR